MLLTDVGDKIHACWWRVGDLKCNGESSQATVIISRDKMWNEQKFWIFIRLFSSPSALWRYQIKPNRRSALRKSKFYRESKVVEDMVRLSACLKAVTALTIEMTHKEQNRFIPTEPGTFFEINGQR